MGKLPVLSLILLLTCIGTASCDVSPSSAGEQTATTDEAGQPFYGIEFVPPEDLQTASRLGAEVVGQTFAHDGSPSEWLSQLDLAHKNNLKVIAWLWPQGWKWSGDAWVIDQQTRSFIDTVAAHPALMAIYAFNEPYWQECWGCGYTTKQQQALYAQITAIQDVPIFSAIGSITFWSQFSKETVFADGVCDFCAVWFYPFTDQGYRQDALKQQIHQEITSAHHLAPHSKIVWYLQGFAQSASSLRMPTQTEMNDLAEIVFTAGVDGALWYVWTFGSLYDDCLSKHPELYDTIHLIYTEQILSGR